MDSNQNTPDSEQLVSDIKTVLNGFQKLNDPPLHPTKYTFYENQLKKMKQDTLRTIFSVLDELLKKEWIPDESIFFWCIKKIADHISDSSAILMLYELAYNKNAINAYVINATIYALKKKQRFFDRNNFKEKILNIFEQAKRLHFEREKSYHAREGLDTIRKFIDNNTERCIDKITYGCVIDAIGNFLDHDEIMALYDEAKSLNAYNDSTVENALKAITKKLTDNLDKKSCISTLLSCISTLLRDLNEFWENDQTSNKDEIRSMKTCTVAIKAAGYLSGTEEQIMLTTWFQRAITIQNLKPKDYCEIYCSMIIALGNQPNHKNQDKILELLNEVKAKNFYTTLLFNKAIRALGNSKPYAKQLNTIFNLYTEEQKHNSLNEKTCTIVIVALGNCTHDLDCSLSLDRKEKILDVFKKAKNTNEAQKRGHCDAILYSSLITALSKDPTYPKKDLLDLFQETKKCNCYNTVTFNSVLGAMANSSYYLDKENDILSFFNQNKNDLHHPFDVITYHSLFKALQSCTDNEKLDIHQNVISIFQEAIEKKCYNESTFGLAINLVANHPAYSEQSQQEQEKNIQLIFKEADNKRRLNLFTYSGMINYISIIALRKRTQDQSNISEQLTELLIQMKTKEKEFDPICYNNIITVLSYVNKYDEILQYLENAIEAGYEGKNLYNTALLALRKNHEKAIDLFEKIRMKDPDGDKEYYDNITFHIAFDILYQYQCSIQDNQTQSYQERKEKLEELNKQQKEWYDQALQKKLLPMPNKSKDSDQHKIDLHHYTFGSTFFHLQHIIVEENHYPNLMIIHGQELHSKAVPSMANNDHGVKGAIKKIYNQYHNIIKYAEDPNNSGVCYFTSLPAPIKHNTSAPARLFHTPSWTNRPNLNRELKSLSAHQQ